MPVEQFDSRVVERSEHETRTHAAPRAAHNRRCEVGDGKLELTQSRLFLGIRLLFLGISRFLGWTLGSAFGFRVFGMRAICHETTP